MKNKFFFLLIFSFLCIFFFLPRNVEASSPTCDAAHTSWACSNCCTWNSDCPVGYKCDLGTYATGCWKCLSSSPPPPPSCTPSTCGSRCGTVSNGCGSTIYCGACAVNGSCGSSANTCSAGSLASTSSDCNLYYWHCNGSNGGSTAYCQANKSPTCGSTHYNCSSCSSATSQAETSGGYTWHCYNSTNGVTASGCSETKATTCNNSTINGCVNGSACTTSSDSSYYYWHCCNSYNGVETTGCSYPKSTTATTVATTTTTRTTTTTTTTAGAVSCPASDCPGGYDYGCYSSCPSGWSSSAYESMAPAGSACGNSICCYRNCPTTTTTSAGTTATTPASGCPSGQSNPWYNCNNGACWGPHDWCGVDECGGSNASCTAPPPPAPSPQIFVFTYWDFNKNGVINSAPPSYQNPIQVGGESFTDYNKNGLWDANLIETYPFRAGSYCTLPFQKSPSWCDWNRDGIQQTSGYAEPYTDSNHNGVYNCTVLTNQEPFVDANSNCAYNSGESFTDLDGNGTHTFGEGQWASANVTAVKGSTTLTGTGGFIVFDQYKPGFTEGTWIVTLTNIPGNATLTTGSNPVTVNVSQNQTEVQFMLGTRPTISGNAYYDTNRNGSKDTGEANYTNATITLAPGSTTTTDANGNYTFTNVNNGNYTVALAVPNGYTATTTNPAPVTVVGVNTTVNFGIAIPIPATTTTTRPPTTTTRPPTTTTIPVPCQVTTSPSVHNLVIGGTGSIAAVVSSGLGVATITRMNFGSYNTSIATVNPTSDVSSIYSTIVTAVAAGPTTAVWATATLSDGRTCQSTGATDTDVNVTTPTPTPTPIPSYTITGTIFVDTTNNGIKDAGESCYAGKIPRIKYGINSQFSLTTFTSTAGCNTYSITTPTLCHNVSIVPPQGYKITGWYGSDSTYTSLNQISSTAYVCGSVVNFGITNAFPWIQSGGGDMRVDSGFNSPIPANPTCGVNSGAYASLRGSGGTPGIIFSGDNTPDFGQGTASQPDSVLGFDWRVTGLFNPVVSKKTSTSMLLSKAAQMGLPIIDIKTACGGNYANCDLPNNLASGVYRADSDLTLTGAGINFSAGQNYVIIVKGNLNINEKIIVPNGSTAIFSAYNIIVASSVGEADSTIITSDIEGWYSADGNFTVNKDNANSCPTSDLKLNIAGSIVTGAAGSGSFVNNRDLCNANARCPTIYIKERPDLILNAPSLIKTSSYTWQEVAP